MTGGFVRYSQEQAGTPLAKSQARAADFSLPRVPTDPGAAATARGQLLRFPLSRHLAHLAYGPPEPELPWRNPLGDADAGLFFDEAEAQRLTLAPRSPGLPHHRHPITTDELLAGAIVALICGAAVVYILWSVL